MPLMKTTAIGVKPRQQHNQQQQQQQQQLQLTR